MPVGVRWIEGLFPYKGGPYKVTTLFSCSFFLVSLLLYLKPEAQHILGSWVGAE